MLRQDTRISTTRQLTGARCKCGGCGEYFNSVYAFDRHRRGDADSSTRYCLTTAQLAANRWTQDALGFWRTPGSAHSRWAHKQISGDRADPAATPRGAA